MGTLTISLCLLALGPQQAPDAGVERVERTGRPAAADTAPALWGEVPLTASWVTEGVASRAERGALQVLSLALEPDLGAGFTARVEFLGKWGHDGAVAFPSSQGLSSLDAEDFRGLGEAWLGWAGGRGARLKAGWVDANTEFAASEVSSAFANPSFGITPALAFMPSYPAPRPSVNGFVSGFGGSELGVGAYQGVDGDWSVVARMSGPLPYAPSLRLQAGLATCGDIVEGLREPSEPAHYLILDWIPDHRLAGFVKMAGAGSLRHLATGLTARLPTRLELNTGLAASLLSDPLGDEAIAELFVAARIADWLLLQPDLQVRFAPGAAPVAAGLLRMVVER